MKISIITPVFNREDCIERCMESVAKSIDFISENNVSRDVFEHIIVNDGSTDNTLKIITAFEKEHKNIRIISFDHNRGTNAARNAAIMAANGDWCVILDSDDYFVETALSTIANIIKEYPQYKHYMFSPDDRLEYYENNQILKGAKSKVLTFENFLFGDVDGDFVHVCNTEVLRKYPFNENLRIYEGVFFLMFYKEAQTMLFTNEIVSIRDRHRNDSVSFDFIQKNRIIVRRAILSANIYIDKFKEDYISLGRIDKLKEKYTQMLDCLLRLGEYEQCRDIIRQMQILGKVPSLLLIIYSFRLGNIYFYIKKFYYVFKYDILKSKL